MPEPIKSFTSPKQFRAWLARNHGKSKGIWLCIYKKGSTKKSITYAEALDQALCYGWIDGLMKGYDEESYIQRFTPRRTKSSWSKINVQHAERLIKSGEMTEAG